MEYIIFGRICAETKPNMFLFQFVDECIANFNLDESKSELLYDLANASSVPECHLIPLTMLIGHGVLERMHPINCVPFLRSIGVQSDEMLYEEQRLLINVLLSWSGVEKCFAASGKFKELIDQAKMIHIGYDAYEHEIISKKQFNELILAEERIRYLEDHLATNVDYPVPRYEWDDFLCQMVRVDSI